ncbi:MAG: glycosyltransferase [Thermoanaerobaculia bacterium]
MTPDVSVVLPLWRPEPDHLREAIRSVLAQTLERFELIIVEDPSDRPGAAIVRELADERVRYVPNATRTSIVEQHNRAVSLARASLIARFDGDDVCEPERLAKQKDLLDAHPEIGVVGCQLLVIGSDGTPVGLRHYPTGPAEIRAAFRRYNPIANPGVMFRSRIVDEHGGWTQGNNGVARDYEWYSRLASRGVVFSNLDEPLVRYRLHQGTLKYRKLRQTIETTLEVKRTYWAREMNAGDRAAMVAERLAAFLPPRAVLALFRRTRLRKLA